MLKYLIINMDDTSISYCHYENNHKVPKIIGLEDLAEGIRFAMKENLSVQIVYPDYELPKDYKILIDTVEHYDIVSSSCENVKLRENADVVVLNNWAIMGTYPFKKGKAYVLRTNLQDFFHHSMSLKKALCESDRLNIVFTDVYNFKDSYTGEYNNALSSLVSVIETNYKNEIYGQLNLLTDRLSLDAMKNCNAGVDSVTLAPDGKFYVCPAFYLPDEENDYGLGQTKFSVGDLAKA